MASIVYVNYQKTVGSIAFEMEFPWLHEAASSVVPAWG